MFLELMWNVWGVVRHLCCDAIANLVRSMLTLGTPPPYVHDRKHVFPVMPFACMGDDDEDVTWDGGKPVRATACGWAGRVGEIGVGGGH